MFLNMLKGGDLNFVIEENRFLLLKSFNIIYSRI